jgi:hypothetical protein
MIRNYILYSGCYHLFALNPHIPPFPPLLLFMKYIHVYIYYIVYLAVIFLFLYITLLHRADKLS